MIPKTHDMLRHRRFPWLVVALCAGLLPFGTQAGTLQLGRPVINGNQYTFPVVLQGNAEEVAALDFRLAYDPEVFTPVGADSGRSAIQAQKQVSFNISAPGEFVVVLMGFNQNTVAPGEVVEVVLEKIGEPAGGNTLLRIAEPTLATNVGVEVDSRGSGRTVRFDSLPENNDADEAGAREADDTTTDPMLLPADNDNLPMTEDTGSAVFGGPVFLTPSSYQAQVEMPTRQATPGTPSKEAGDRRRPAPGLSATNPSERPEELPGDSTGTPTSPQKVGAIAQATSKTQRDGTVVEGITDQFPKKIDAQPVDPKEVMPGETEKSPQNTEKGGQAGYKYATLLLFAIGVPLGLVIMVRIAGK